MRNLPVVRVVFVILEHEDGNVLRVKKLGESGKENVEENGVV